MIVVIVIVVGNEEIFRFLLLVEAMVEFCAKWLDMSVLKRLPCVKLTR